MHHEVRVSGLGTAIATITLDRPGKLNAMDLSMWRGLTHAVETIAADDAARAVIVRSSSSSAFCTGADLSEWESDRGTGQSEREYEDLSLGTMQRLSTMPQFTVAALRGFCVGGGLELALACDIRLADTTARIGVTPARVGIVYGLTQTKRLVDLVGPSRAKLMLATASLIDADTSLRCGLVDEVLPGEKLDDRVRELTHTITANAPFSVRSSREIVRRILQGQNADDDDTRALYARGYASEDHAEGIAAFKQRRRPVFTGS